MKRASTLATPLAQVAAFLAETVGVDPLSLDANHLRWVVEGRCRQLKIDDPAMYAKYLHASDGEAELLIHATVVQETRFFRDPLVFEHLGRWLPQMAAQFPGELRILSAPCSTGQEAYSLAAALQMAGLPLARFRIDAFDISESGLAIARSGQYPEEALRSLSPKLQSACGTLHNKQWMMHDALRQRIRFERRNLALDGALTSRENDAAFQPYHLILCRNLFIYLRAETRAVLAHSLANALMPGGRLILGSADRVKEISHLFAPLKPAASFAFTLRHESAGVETNKTVARSRTMHATFHARPSATKQPAHAASTAPLPLSTSAGLYQRALDHYQHGELRKAERRCRQALYLEPQMLPALELLESLWSEHPNLRLRRALEARILRHRIETSHAPDAQKEMA